MRKKSIYKNYILISRNIKKEAKRDALAFFVNLLAIAGLVLILFLVFLMLLKSKF